ncbi:hypothetical protein PF010_g14767 [Phytophthora fragariae]|uniref:Uncharacterized protein n=1 Tax=Phytophthora fragariae TaxID=53985 RepID=A0A6A4EAQ6_9STRA|nr:hypothetical protein PF003_g18971 [Phytophthora fragariae]KAE8943110.1 hypothetical protein PF009_g7159 [Phytophthora fragariae]KAE9020295.1 hypothetical protein PF011_g5479 [Phytophthora fragariae]KAE9100596.1 hypothetical protein PF010_g14767 [Phytophthora fragariae]KAE9123933.1 hypothetical protein PF007_g6889 [Phytophthora fragariae]
MASAGERLLLSLALGAALAACGYYCSKLVGRRRPKSLAALRLAAAPRWSLRELSLRSSGRWVALCGTAFDVTGDPFFDEQCAGIYSSWVGHDITYLLLQLGLTPDAADDAEAVASYLDREWPLGALQRDGEAVRRRRELLQEWFMRLHSRYEVVAQLSDRYVGAEWDALRESLLPSDSDSSSGGKCPLGFGAKTVSKVVSRKAKELKSMRTITFQGRRYDVSNSSLFQPEGGQFAHFVGHDVTYALAVQSTRDEDLDVTPPREYTFEEQLLLERYRNFFARELALVEVDAKQKESGDQSEIVNLHQVVEESDGMIQEESVQRMKKVLEGASSEQVNAMCTRTTMTPLHKAVEKHRLDLVKVLIQAGADVMARAALYDDETPLEMAHRFHFVDIATHLESVAVSG